MLKERLEIEKIMEARFEDGFENGQEIGYEKGKRDGELKGELKGKIKSILNLYQDGFISKSIVLEKLNVSEEKLEALMKKYQ